MLPKCRITVHPGEFIRDEIAAREWSQAQLAQLLGYTPAYVSDVLNGRRGLSAEAAIRCSEAFGTSPEYFWNLQCNHELTKAMNTRARPRKRRKKDGE